MKKKHARKHMIVKIPSLIKDRTFEILDTKEKYAILLDTEDSTRYIVHYGLLQRVDVEPGDTVKLRDDLTVRELNIDPIMVGFMWDKVLKGNHAKVRSFSIINDDMVYLEGSEAPWHKEWFEIVKKKPETLYFDARKSCYFVGEPKKASMAGNINDIPISSHGKKREDLSKDIPINWFTTKKPKPLKMMNGEIK